MIIYKQGVPVGITSTPINRALDILEEEFSNHDINLVVTSTSDGKHMRTSKHYDMPCNAVDIRIWNILERVAEKMREKLGKHYDIVIEKDHIHIEYDPKEG